MVNSLQKAFWFGFFLLALSWLAMPVAATDFHATSTQIELKTPSHSDWDNSIEARNNEWVDARLKVLLESDSADSAKVSTYLKIWGRKAGGDWEIVDETETKSRFMNPGDEEWFSWPEEFRVSQDFQEYRTDGFAKAQGENYGSAINAKITRVLSESKCSDIRIEVSDISIPENDSKTFSLDVWNNSEDDFFVSSVQFIENSDFFSIEEKSHDSEIAPGESGKVRFRVISDSVSGNRTGTVSVEVAGHFDGVSCPAFSIGSKNFSVTVREDSSSSSSGYCGKIQIGAFPALLPKNFFLVKNFSILNNSDKRFNILEAQIQSDAGFFSVSRDSLDSSINPFSEGRLGIRIASNSVSSAQSAPVTVKLRGEFENGPSCGLDDVPQKTFTVTIEPDSRGSSCNALVSEVSDIRMGENNEREFVFRLQNNSGKRFDIKEIEPFENETDFELHTVSNPSSAPPYGAAEIRLRARTHGTASDQTLLGTVRIRGEFEGGLSCGFNELSSQLRFLIFAEDGGQENGDEFGICSDMDIQTETVELNAGDNIEQEFFVKNNSNKTFFVEGIEAYDNSSGVIVTPGDFDTIIEPGERGGLRVGIETDSSGESRTVSGYVKVRGHFSNDQYCSAASIGTQRFSIHINASGSGSSGSSGGSGSSSSGSCREMRVSVPTVVSVNQSGNVSFSVNNPSSKTAFVFLGGASLSVSPNTFSTAPNSNRTYSATVQYFDRGSTRLEYLLIGENCQGSTQYTTVYNTASSGGLENQFGYVPSGGEIQIVSAPGQLVFVKRTTVIATIRNNSAIPKTIQTRLEGFSPNWNMDKLSLGFKPFETKTVYLDAYSNNNFSSFTGTLTAESGNQKEQRVLRLTAVQVLGFGNDFVVETQGQKTGTNSFEILAKLQNNFGQQLNGLASLETLDGAILEQKTFVTNPQTSQTVSFTVQGKQNEFLPEALHVRLVLEDGRSAVQRVELAPTAGGLGSFQNWGPALALLGADNWTPILLGILIILLLLAIWVSRKPRMVQPYQKQAPKREILNAPTAPEPTPVSAAGTTTVQTTQTQATGANGDRFWFLRGQ